MREFIAELESTWQRFRYNNTKRVTRFVSKILFTDLFGIKYNRISASKKQIKIVLFQLRIRPYKTYRAIDFSMYRYLTKHDFPFFTHFTKVLVGTTWVGIATPDVIAPA